MKKLLIPFLIILFICTSFAPATPLFAEGVEFKDTATGKAAKELIESLGNVINDVAAMKGMTLQQQLDYVRTKGKERIWSKTKEKSWDKFKSVVTDYAKEKMRSDYFKSKAGYMMQQCVVDRKAVSAVWQEVDAEIGSKISTNLNALSKALDGLEVLKGSYDAWSEKGAEDGLRALGVGIADKIFEYSIPGWGYYRLAQALVEALGNYVMAYAFDDALQSKREAILPFDPKKDSKAFANWLLTTEVKPFVDLAWVEQIGYTGAYAKYDGKDETKEEFGDAMKQKIIDNLTRLKDELLQKKQIEDSLKSQIEAQDAKARAAGQAVKAVTDQAIKEADVYLSRIEAFEQKYYGLQKQDIQTGMNSAQKEFEQTQAEDARQQYHYKPLNRAAIISAMEAGYSEVTETFSQGYDYNKLYDAVARYADTKDEVLKANWVQFTEWLAKLNEEIVIANKRSAALEQQIKAATDENASRALLERKQQLQNEIAAVLDPLREILGLGSEERGKDIGLLNSAEAMVNLDVEGRNHQMTQKLEKDLAALQTEMDKAKETYLTEEAEVDGEIATLNYPSPSAEAGLPGKDMLPSARRYPQELLETLTAVQMVKDKIIADSKKAPELFAKKTAILKNYIAAVDSGRSKFYVIVPEKWRSMPENGGYQSWYVKQPDMDFNNQRLMRGGSAIKAVIKVAEPGTGVSVLGGLEASLKSCQEAQNINYEKAIKAVNEVLSEDEALEPAARIAIAFSLKLNSVFQDLLPYEAGNLKKITFDTLLVSKDGKTGAGVDPAESDGAKFLEDMKDAWEKHKGDVEALQRMMEAYKKAAGNFHFESGDITRDFPAYNDYVQIPDRIKEYEAALAKAGDRLKWLLENTPKDIEKWRADMNDMMKINVDLAGRYQKLRLMGDSVNLRLGEIDRYKSKPEFAKLEAELNAFFKTLKDATQLTDDILLGKVPPPVDPGNKPDGNKDEPQRRDQNTDYQLFNVRLNTFSLDSASGDVVLTRNQLIQGTLQVTAKLSTLDRVDKLLVSDDGGRTWSEIAKDSMINHVLTPVFGKRYDMVLRIKTNGFQDVDLKFFPSVNSIAVQDMDANQLIVQAVKEFSDAYEMKNTGRIDDLISRDFLGDKTLLLEGIRFDYDMFNDIRLTIYINRITQQKDLYSVETKWDKTQTPRKTNQDQRTSGKTTMVFVLEEGKMKIQNLRGNLIYATLSPEIAAASGLSQKVIEEIQAAHDARIPVQPGAGQTENSGGVDDSPAGPPINKQSGLILNLNSFDFSTGTSVAVVGSNDISNVGLDIHFNNSCKYQTTSSSFESLTTAPVSGYINFPAVTATAGTVLIIKTNSGQYGKMKITTVQGGLQSFNFDYAVQTDGSTNIATV